MDNVLTIRPEKPVEEVWEWQTDVITADDGTEQRIALTEVPRRTVGGTYKFDDQALFNQHLMRLTAAKGAGVNVPFYQYATRLTAPAAAGAGALQFDARKTQIADTDFAIIINDAETRFEIVQAGVVSAGDATLVTPLQQDWPARSFIAPVHFGFAARGATINRRGVDGFASLNMQTRETAFHTPFVNPLNAAALTLIDGFPVLPDRPVGTSFDEQMIEGTRVIDHGGTITIQSPWKRSKIMFDRTFRVDRLFDLPAWEWWFVFADALKGSQKPFWLPSYRQDFTVTAAPVPGGAALTLGGHFFRDFCFPHAGLRGIFIDTEAGTHFALVTAVADDGENDRVTFEPALPAGAGYAINQKVGLLYKSRLADDRVAWRHFDAISYASLSILTTDD